MITFVGGGTQEYNQLRKWEILRHIEITITSLIRSITVCGSDPTTHF